MKQLFWLLVIIFLVQCEKQTTEPKIEYHTVQYFVLVTGDTTEISYRDQNEELKQLVITRGTPTWVHEFKSEKGTNLYIGATSWGGEFYADFFTYKLIHVFVAISIDDGRVASGESRAYDGDCACFEPLGSFGGWCSCTASASFAGILW